MKFIQGSAGNFSVSVKYNLSSFYSGVEKAYFPGWVETQCSHKPNSGQLVRIFRLLDRAYKPYHMNNEWKYYRYEHSYL